MTTNLARERTRRLIGRRIRCCPVCDKPLSFIDDRPFCRCCGLPSGKIVDILARYAAPGDELKDAMEGRR